jgi:catechol 2,3-dioxygenase-like lactoylglutathione lyase family enzyme
MKLQPAVPVFRIFDAAMAKNFYVDWLGFKIDWEHQFDATAPRYFQISRGAAVLHLSEHFGDCCPGAKTLIDVDDIAGLHQEVHSRPNPNMRPGLETEDWGAKTMTVIDPFGNRLVFSQRLCNP